MKTTAFALAALIAGSAIAAPVLASDSFDSDRYITLLSYEGVNAIAVEDYWQDALKATVKLDDGTTVFRFYDKDSLQPVNFGR
ncbi:MAG: hypothetical protein EOP22_18955 [Hyphomicrobiales bacterium]|nr:MAG: hypothetical protein EOP22_18955 [Hyphomicrobiales bacterium]